MYTIKFMFDYGAENSCLWSVGSAAKNTFGEGIIPLNKLNLSTQLEDQLKSLCVEYQASLCWDDPTADTPWSQEQIENFRVKSQNAFSALVEELGPDFAVQNLIDMCLDFGN